MTAVLSVIAGFAGALGGVFWDAMAVVGCTVTGCTVIVVLWCLVATRGQRREPLRVVIAGHAETGGAETGGAEVDDDIDVPDWLKAGRRG